MVESIGPAMMAGISVGSGILTYVYGRAAYGHSVELATSVRKYENALKNWRSEGNALYYKKAGMEVARAKTLVSVATFFFLTCGTLSMAFLSFVWFVRVW